MTYTYDPEYVEQMKDMLMAVGRTNLMAPSKEEFGRLTVRHSVTPSVTPHYTHQHPVTQHNNPNRDRSDR